MISKLASGRVAFQQLTLHISRFTWLWLAFMVALPIVDWLTRGELYPQLAMVSVLLQVMASLAALRWAWPWRRITLTLCVVAALTWFAEWLGSTTGLPFGEYSYTALLQPQLAGVPLLIPLAWLMMLPPTWAVVSALVSPNNRLAFAALSGVAFTAWDLYLDPQMVARGLWVWAEPSGYFGIPWINFFGWWLISSLVTFIIAPKNFEPARKPLAVIYTLTWALQAIGLGLFWGQPGPALVGFLAMGVFGVGFWRVSSRKGHEARKVYFS